MVMKKIWVFLLGVLAGLVLFFIISCIIAFTNSSSSEDDNFIRFPEMGECISNNRFKVIQVLDNGIALAKESSSDNEDFDFYTGITVLFITKDKYYYDGEIITPSHGQCVRQVGIYRYETRNDIGKTVPAVTLYKN